MADIEQLRAEAENLRRKIRVCVFQVEGSIDLHANHSVRVDIKFYGGKWWHA